MQTIVFATISLNAMAGGLEKNIVLLSNHLSEHGFNVQLVTFDLKDAKSFYKINKKVRWHKIGVGEPHAGISLLNRVNLICNIRNIIAGLKSSKKSPVIICFHHGILFRFLAASFLSGVKIICSERNSLSLYNHISKKKWNLNFFLLSFIQKIVVQFPEYQQDYPIWLRQRITSIPNPVLATQYIAKTNIAGWNSRFNVLTVGRLGAQKQTHILINAFALLSDRYPKWDLVIVGDGALRTKLENIINDKALFHRIFLVGKSKNISQWMQKSHLFCLPSQWEGFPNALAEALAHGLPSVGFSNCAGVNKLIVHNKNGLLANGNSDPQALAVSLSMLMGSSSRRQEMGHAAVESVSQYLPDVIFEQWIKLLSTVVEG